MPAFFIHRQGDYTRTLRFFERYRLWVAPAGERIVGTVSWSYRAVLEEFIPAGRRIFFDFSLA